jgi:hypothetical protein
MAQRHGKPLRFQQRSDGGSLRSPNLKDRGPTRRKQAG